MSDQFNKLAVERTVQKMFTGKHFSICDFDALAELIGASPNEKIRRQLRAYHCVNFSDMSTIEKQLIQSKTIEALRGDEVLNPARVLSELTDEGRDFTFTEDRYIDFPKEKNASKLLKLIGRG